MPRNITKKQKEFADAYLETGNGTQTVLKVYDTDDYSTASAIASENLEKPKIIEYMQSKAPMAASQILKLSQTAQNEAVRLNASKDILDRAGFKPIEKSQNIQMQVQTSIEDLEKYKVLKDKFEQELIETLQSET